MDSPAKVFWRADDGVINTFICSMWEMLAGVGIWVKGGNVTFEEEAKMGVKRQRDSSAAMRFARNDIWVEVEHPHPSPPPRRERGYQAARRMPMMA